MNVGRSLQGRMNKRSKTKYQGGRQQKRGIQRQRPLFGMEACTKQHEVQNTKVVGRLVGNNFRFVQRIQPAAFAKHA